MTYITQGLSLAQDHEQTRWVAPLLLAADTVLTAGVIWKIPYTEIDWTTYMQQVEVYLKGEMNYSKIVGSTGPLVYPGFHVWIYRYLHALTGNGDDIFSAQIIFALLYLATLGLVMATYRAAKVPPYIFPLLILSKRLHSIFVLRLFNDCFTIFFLFAAIYSFQRRKWYLGSLLYSCGLGVKMNLLLVAPALALLCLQGLGLDRSVTQAMVVAQTQGLFAYQFVRVDWKAYVGNAFQLNRQFLYRWTVNWRFVPEDIFLSAPFSYGLLCTHATLLFLFASTRWTQPARRSLTETIQLYLGKPDEDEADAVADRVTPDFILTILLSANLVGMLCARSLHYQFYSWLAWSSPFLLWRAGFHPVLIYALWAAQEWAWNTYPSTDASSAFVVASLAIQVAGIWWGTRETGPEKDIADKKVQ